MTNDQRPNPATAKRDADLRLIAKRHLDLDSFEARGRDHLDFREVAVWSIRDALRAAYAAGYEQAVTDRERPESELVPVAFACPKCSERDMDQLICDEDGEIVTCLSCGTKYVVMQQS